MGNLQKLKLIRNCLTPEATATIAIGLVTSHLDYANAIYSGLLKSDLGKVQRIQNMAATLVTKARKYDSSTEALKSLHWLPIHLRKECKVLNISLQGHSWTRSSLLIRPHHHQHRSEVWIALIVHSLYSGGSSHQEKDIR